MAKVRERGANGSEPVISIIAAGMRVTGDCVVAGTLRIEGEVVGSVHAGKGVVVGRDGLLHGDLATHDAVVAGRVRGTVIAASRLEVHASARIDGEVHTRRMLLEEGGVLNGAVHMGETELPELSGSSPQASGEGPAGLAREADTPPASSADAGRM